MSIPHQATQHRNRPCSSSQMKVDGVGRQTSHSWQKLPVARARAHRSHDQEAGASWATIGENWRDSARLGKNWATSWLALKLCYTRIRLQETVFFVDAIGEQVGGGLPHVLAVESVKSYERRQARAHDIGGGVEQWHAV